jgi:hypothetical protein
MIRRFSRFAVFASASCSRKSSIWRRSIAMISHCAPPGVLDGGTYTHTVPSASFSARSVPRTIRLRTASLLIPRRWAAPATVRRSCTPVPCTASSSLFYPDMIQCSAHVRLLQVPLRPRQAPSENAPYSITYVDSPAGHFLPERIETRKGHKKTLREQGESTRNRARPSDPELTDAVGPLPRCRVAMCNGSENDGKLDALQR